MLVLADGHEAAEHHDNVNCDETQHAVQRNEHNELQCNVRTVVRCTAHGTEATTVMAILFQHNVLGRVGNWIFMHISKGRDRKDWPQYPINCTTYKNGSILDGPYLACILTYPLGLADIAADEPTAQLCVP
jgi:hypothetical protein